MIGILAWIAALAAPARPAEVRAPHSGAAAVEHFAQEYLPWEPESRVTARPEPAQDLAGFHAWSIERKGKYEKLEVKATYLVSDDGQWIFTGNLVKNTADQKKTRPITSNEDLAGVSGYFSGLFHSRATAVLDKPADRAGLKGVSVLLNTGYFTQPVRAYVEADGSGLLVGQIWKLHESVPAQRRAIMDLSDSASQGPASAKYTIVEYADMECPFCKKRGLQMDRLMDEYSGKLSLRRVYRYYPLWVNHVWSPKAASAAVCLSHYNPNYVFQFKKLAYENQDTLTVAGIDELAVNFAEANNVPKGEFLSCYLHDASFATVRRDMDEGGHLGVISTPTYYINGVEIYWLPDDVMEEYLKTLLGASRRG